MKTVISSILVFFFLFISSVHAQVEYAWSNHIGATSADDARVVTLDNSGNVYIAGSFRGTTDFDPGPGVFTVTSAGGDDGYIAKYDASGNFLSAFTFSNTLNCKVYSIDVDNLGNIVATGDFNGTVDFDPTAGVFTLSSPTNSDFFVAKINSNGTFAWAMKAGVNGVDDRGLGIKVDLSNDIVVTGYFIGNVDFNPGPGVNNLLSSGGGDSFVLKLTSSGVYSWAFNIGNGVNSTDAGNSLDIDPTGNIYVGGFFQAICDFDPGPSTYTLSATGAQDGYLAKYTSAGNFIWAKQLDGTGKCQLNSLNIDPNGNVYSTGSFTGSIDFDGDAPSYTLASASSTNDIFVVKYSSAGAFIWANKIGGLYDDNGYALVSDNSGVYVTGSFSNTVDFDPSISTNTIAALGYRDFFITKLDGSGNHVFTKAFGSSVDNDISYGVASPSANVIYLTGSFGGPIDLNPSPFSNTLTTSYGNYDIFMLKLMPCSQTISLTASNASICLGSSATLSASGSTTLNWSTGPTTPTILVTPTITTNYSVSGSFTTGCVDTKTIDVVVVVCAIVNEDVKEPSNYSIYPNPTTGEFTIAAKNYSTPLSCEIYNNLGELIYVDLINEKSDIKLNQIPAGVYLVRLLDESNIIVNQKKLIKN